MSGTKDTKSGTVCCYCKKDEKEFPAVALMCGHSAHIRCIPCGKTVTTAAQADSKAVKPSAWYADSVSDTNIAHTSEHLSKIREKLNHDTRRVQYKLLLTTVSIVPKAVLPPESDEGDTGNNLRRTPASGRNRAAH